MPYFKDQSNGLHWLDSLDFVDLLPQGCVEIMDTEAESIRQASIPVPSHNDIIKEQIIAIEATVTERRTREAVLGIDNGWLKGVNDQIAALRSQLV